MAPTKEDTVVPPGDCKASVAMINAGKVEVKKEIRGFVSKTSRNSYGCT
jgi:hypothetical protein